MYPSSPRRLHALAGAMLPLPLLLLVAPSLSSSAATSPHVSSSLGSRSSTSANETSWHQYVRAPPSTTVRPAAVLADRTTGDVTNPEAVLQDSNDDADVAVLRRGGGADDEVPTVVLDFGQNVVGLLVIEFAGSSSSTTLTAEENHEEEAEARPGIRLTFSESLDYLGERSDFTRSDNAEGDPPKICPDGTDQIAVAAEPYTWVDQWGCDQNATQQVCSDGLHGFRYVKISLDALESDSPHTTASGSVSIASVSLRWSGYLGTPDTFAGWFESSDPELNRWWFEGAYTVDMNVDVFRANDTDPRQAVSASLLGKRVLYDGAKRDRDPYMGDLATASLTSYLSHDDAHDASTNIMEDLALHQRDDGWIPPASIRDYGLLLFDYPLWWASCLWDHAMYTGNLTLSEHHWPNLRAVLDDYYPAQTDNATGLLLRPEGYGDYAFTPREGSAGYYSALYVLALNRAAELADILAVDDEMQEDAARWRDRAAVLSRAFLDVLWDDQVGAFLDRRCDDGTGACAAHAQDGNSLAVLSGIVASAGDSDNNNNNSSVSASSLLDYLGSDAGLRRDWGNAFFDAAGESVQAGFSDRSYALISYFEMAARFQTPGHEASALDQLRRTYRAMSRAEGDEGTGTFWEGVGADASKYQGGFTSLAHGWSTGVTPLLTGYVLGARPTGPGFATWTVAPKMPASGGDDQLTWARGQVPTPYGPMLVSWEKKSEEEDGSYVVEVDAPEGTEGTVTAPEGSSAGRRSAAMMVKLDGAVVGEGPERSVGADGRVEVRVQGGKKHVVEFA